MSFIEYLLESNDRCEDCETEVVYVSEDGEVYTEEEVLALDESVIRQFARKKTDFLKKFRCLTGNKAGRMVNNPADCNTRKDPRKIRQGQRIMKSKGATIQRKSDVSKRTSVSKLLTKMNLRLKGDHRIGK
jgi:hypothetical protein